MAVNSNGSNNRVAGRDFHEKNIQIGRYDGSHTVNIAILRIMMMTIALCLRLSARS